MIKLLNRKTRKHATVATIVFNPSDDTQDRFMAKGDAEELWAKGKLQKLLDTGSPCAYGPPRSFRQMCHSTWPTFHPDVLALIAKYENSKGTKS